MNSTTCMKKLVNPTVKSLFLILYFSPNKDPKSVLLSIIAILQRYRNIMSLPWFLNLSHKFAHCYAENSIHIMYTFCLKHV